MYVRMDEQGDIQTVNVIRRGISFAKTTANNEISLENTFASPPSRTYVRTEEVNCKFASYPNRCNFV